MEYVTETAAESCINRLIFPLGLTEETLRKL